MAQRNSEIILVPAQRNTQALDELKFGDGSPMSLTDLFGKRFDGSVITKEFELINRPVQTFVRRDFIYLSRCFYVSSVLTENKNVDQAKMAALEAELLAIFAAVRVLVGTRLREVSSLLQNHGADKDEVRTSRPMFYRVPIIHPRAYEFLTLLREVDELHSKREHAWLLGHLSPIQRSENFRETMKAVRRIGFVTRMNRIAMWKILQRAAEESEGDEKDSLHHLAQEQSATLAAERTLDKDSAVSVSAEAGLPTEAGIYALPAEAGAKIAVESSQAPAPEKASKARGKATESAAPAEQA